MYTPRSNSSPATCHNLFVALQVPLERLPEQVLAAPHDGLAVARDDRVEVPGVDAADALVEGGAVPPADDVPEEAPEALGVAGRAVGALEHAVQQAVRRLVGGGHPRVLLDGGQVEHEVGLDQDAVGLEEQDDLLVGVGADELDLEVGGEVGVDLVRARVGRVPLERERLRPDPGVVLHGRALRVQALGPDELGPGVRFCPVRKEDVVLHVPRDEVPYIAAQLGDPGLDLGR